MLLLRHISATVTVTTTTTAAGTVVTCVSGSVTCLSLSIDGSTLASGSTDSTVRLWNTQSRQCVKVIQHAGLKITARHVFSSVVLRLTSEKTLCHTVFRF